MHFERGELVTKPVRAIPPAVQATPGRDAGPVPVVPAPKPLATLAEVDAAIARVRLAIAAARDEEADFTARLSAPKTKATRLARLLTGTVDEDAAALTAERDAVRDRRASLEADARELSAAREPFLAAADCYRYDADLRPKLRQAVADLARHLGAAAAVYAEYADTIADADRLHQGGIVRGILSERRGDGDLPAPDGRELLVLTQWRKLLVADPPNKSRLDNWRADCAAAGVALDAKPAKK